jgi:hypothetical protein
MGLKETLKRLERHIIESETEEDACARKEREWLERANTAYSMIAETMSDEHAGLVFAELKSFYACADADMQSAPLSSPAKEVQTMAHQYANGVRNEQEMAMPPALFDVWRRFDESGEPSSSHVECADCGADYPYIFGNYDSERGCDGRPERKFVDACLLCGGEVGFCHYSNPNMRLIHGRGIAV